MVGCLRGMGCHVLLVLGTLSLSLHPCFATPGPDPLPGSLSKGGLGKNPKNPYCSIACQSGFPHTLCQYSPGMSASCKNGRSGQLSPSEIKDLVHAHNLLRNRMAAGGVEGFPSASNMFEMVWDEELARIAQRWADQCHFAHDSCRDSERFPVGQNVAIYFSSAARFPPIETRVNSWYDEIKDYKYAPGPFKFSTATGHFSQCVWGETTLVGCGRAYYDGVYSTQLLVCNYGPAGNVEQKPLYETGTPCSACGYKCSQTYSALCDPSQVGKNTDEDFPPPVHVHHHVHRPHKHNPFDGVSTFTTARPPVNTTITSRFAITTARTTTTRKTTTLTTRRVAPSTTPAPRAKPSSTTRRVTTSKTSVAPPRPTAPATLAKRPTPPSTTTTAPSTTPPAPVCPVPKGTGTSCKQHRAAPLSPTEKVVMLDFHNKKRNAVALGDLPEFRAAADMRQMYWDDELEALAQDWADKCQWGHDPCRSTDRWSFKGQNLGLTYSLDWNFPASTDRVEDWYQELNRYNYSSGPFTFTAETSHFTQLAWAETWLVGCGRSRYMSEHNVPSEYLVCNYGPGGNVFGRPLYREGKPCSSCPAGCSERYPGLCERAEAPNNGSSNELGAGLPPLLPISLDAPSEPPVISERATISPAEPTVCPRKPGPGPSCIGFKPAPLSEDEKATLLRRHNEYRAQIAAGQIPGFSTSAAMLEMVWDDKIAAIAQNWADQCSFGYDECAKTDEFRLGQNMAMWYSQDPSLFPAPEGRVDGWFAEHGHYNYSDGDFKFSPTTAAFSQVAWGDSWLLGCARSRFTTGAVLTELLVCNYGPGGNVLGGSLYRPGSPCSACPAACSAKYPALCATTQRESRATAAQEVCPHPPGPGPSCQGFSRAPISERERGQLLDAHNTFRSSLAKGEVLGFPKAANMRQLKWDPELAALATVWAEQCTIGFDVCADSGRFVATGQSSGIMSAWDNKLPPSTELIRTWQNEIELYNYTSGSFVFSYGTSHFTQMAWAETQAVGCGRARFLVAAVPSEQLVCFYGPGGNVLGEPLYQEGRPCSSCGTNQCSPLYPGLCAV